MRVETIVWSVVFPASSRQSLYSPKHMEQSRQNCWSWCLNIDWYFSKHFLIVYPSISQFYRWFWQDNVRIGAVPNTTECLSASLVSVSCLQWHSSGCVKTFPDTAKYPLAGNCCSTPLHTAGLEPAHSPSSRSHWTERCTLKAIHVTNKESSTLCFPT